MLKMAASMAAILFQQHMQPVGADSSAKLLVPKGFAGKPAPTKPVRPIPNQETHAAQPD
jgi:hypothetical protein